MKPHWLWIASVAGLLAGCAGKPAARLNAPPHGVEQSAEEDLKPRMEGTFAYMADNALLADMTVSDMHFLPHRDQLNTLGEQRLSRLAQLMEAYGGTVRFSTNEEDQGLIDRRTETIRSFLAEAGIDTSKEAVTRDLPGGRGMQATEAMLIRAERGTFKPDQTKSADRGGDTTRP